MGIGILNKVSSYSAILNNIELECKMKQNPKEKLLSMVYNFYEFGGMSEADKNKAIAMINEAYPS